MENDRSLPTFYGNSNLSRRRVGLFVDFRIIFSGKFIATGRKF